MNHDDNIPLAVSIAEQALRDLLHAHHRLESAAMFVAHQTSERAGDIGMLVGLIRLILRALTGSAINWPLMVANIATTCERIERAAMQDAEALETVLGECCRPVARYATQH